MVLMIGTPLFAASAQRSTQDSTAMRAIDSVPRPAYDSVAAGARPITLGEAIRLSHQYSPQTIAAREAERANQASVKAAYGAFIPSLSASVGTVRQFTGAGSTTRVNQSGEEVTISGNQWTYSSGFSLNTQLFSANLIPNLRAAQSDVVAARANTTVQTYAVTLSVEQQFYAAVAAQENEDAARTQLAQAQQQLDASRQRVNIGSATASDSLTALVEVATARLALITAQNNRRDANAALTRLVGSATPVAANTNDLSVLMLDTLHLDSTRIVNAAIASPSVAEARASVSSAKSRVQAARASYFPTISAGYSRGGSGLDSRFGLGDDPYSYNGQLNVSVNVPIFSQFSQQAQVASASANEVNAEASLRDTQLQATQLAVQYLDAFQLGQEQIAEQVLSIAAAVENLRVVRQRYDLGLSTIVDVLTAQTTLNQARASLIAARNTVRLATAQIEALIGQPLRTVMPASPAVPTTGTSAPQGVTR